MPFLSGLGVLLPVSKDFRLKLFGAISLAYSLDRGFILEAAACYRIQWFYSA